MSKFHLCALAAIALIAAGCAGEPRPPHDEHMQVATQTAPEQTGGTRDGVVRADSRDAAREGAKAKVQVANSGVCAGRDDTSCYRYAQTLEREGKTKRAIEAYNYACSRMQYQEACVKAQHLETFGADKNSNSMRW